MVWACAVDVDLLEVHSELWISPGSLQYAGEISAGTRCGADLESGPLQIVDLVVVLVSVEDLDGAFLCTLILSESSLHLGSWEGLLLAWILTGPFWILVGP